MEPMKLQPASRKEVSRIAVGCSVCALLLILGLFILSLLGIGTFSYRVIIGAAGGTAVSIFNFALMCLMVQNAAGIQDQKRLKLKVQSSYNLRILLQAAWVAIAFFVPWIHVIAAAVPLLFPTAVIYFLQATGRLMPKTGESALRASTPAPELEEESEDNLGPFEV